MKFLLDLSPVSGGFAIERISTEATDMLDESTMRLDYGVDVEIHNGDAKGCTLAIHYWDGDGDTGRNILFANGAKMDIAFKTNPVDDEYYMCVIACENMLEGEASDVALTDVDNRFELCDTYELREFQLHFAQRCGEEASKKCPVKYFAY